MPLYATFAAVTLFIPAYVGEVIINITLQCCKASAIFQKKLEKELRPVPKTVVKIDDILISGVDDEDHMKNPTAVFDILSKLGLTLNKSKCRFFQQEVYHLCFFLDKTGI